MINSISTSQPYTPICRHHLTKKKHFIQSSEIIMHLMGLSLSMLFDLDIYLKMKSEEREREEIRKDLDLNMLLSSIIIHTRKIINTTHTHLIHMSVHNNNK